MRISKILLLLLIISFVGSIGQTKSSSKSKTTKAKEETVQYVPPPPPPKDGVIIHISSGLDSPTSVLAGLTKALKMSDRYDVYVFFDVNGPEVVLSSSKSLEYKKYEPSKLIITKLIDKGVPIAACSMCLEMMNRTQFDLMKGVRLANLEDFFDFTKGRILTLDY